MHHNVCRELLHLENVTTVLFLTKLFFYQTTIEFLDITTLVPPHSILIFQLIDLPMMTIFKNKILYFIQQNSRMKNYRFLIYLKIEFIIINLYSISVERNHEFLVANKC